MLGMQDCGTSAKENCARGEEQPKAESMCATGSQTGAVGLPTPLELRVFQVLDARHGTVGFVVFSAGFLSCCGPIFPYYAFIPL